MRKTSLLAGALLLVLGAGADLPAQQPAPVPPARLDQAVQQAWPRSRVSEELLRRLAQDETMQVCSATRNNPNAAQEEAIRTRELARIQYPADGRFMGDWRRGIESSLSGFGLRMGDSPSRPNGGNCFACHQITPTEISFGTLGPPLLGYGAARGNTPEVQRQVYEKIFNPHAAFPCSNMPRFGTNGFLTIDQIRDFVAMLLDPASPVNAPR